MPSRTVRYWHKIDDDAFEPLATDRAGLRIECQARGLKWCSRCRAAVAPEGRLDVDGIIDLCPFCGEEVHDPK